MNIVCKKNTQLLQITDEDAICDKCKESKRGTHSGVRDLDLQELGKKTAPPHKEKLMHFICLDLKSASQSSQSFLSTLVSKEPFL